MLSLRAENAAWRKVINLIAINFVRNMDRAERLAFILSLATNIKDPISKSTCTTG